MSASKAELATICLGCSMVFPSHWQCINGQHITCRCGVEWKFAALTGWRLHGVVKDPCLKCGLPLLPCRTCGKPSLCGELWCAADQPEEPW